MWKKTEYTKKILTKHDNASITSTARTWNALPSGIRAAPPLTTFHQKLKQTRFLQSFPDE